MSDPSTARLVVLLSVASQNWVICGPRDELYQQYEELREALTSCRGGFIELIAEQDIRRRAGEVILVKLEDVVAVSFQEP